jgi:hypothetical protein
MQRRAGLIPAGFPHKALKRQLGDLVMLAGSESAHYLFIFHSSTSGKRRALDGIEPSTRGFSACSAHGQYVRPLRLELTPKSLYCCFDSPPD